MKNLLILLGLACIQAASAQTLLFCDDTKFSDLVSVEVVQDKFSETMQVIETDAEGVKHFHRESINQLESGEIPLKLDWYGYKRTLVKYGNEWSMEHRDECSGGISSIRCTEK